MPEAFQVPVPDDDDGLMADTFAHDHWQVTGNLLIRHHRVPRMRTFNPNEDPSCPIPMKCILPSRITQGKYRSGEPVELQETWQDNVTSHRCLADAWTGRTIFQINQKELEQANMLETQFSADDVKPTGIVCEVFLTMSELQQCRHVPYQQQEALIASAAKRQKVEVKLKDLTPSERKEFDQAKTKEIDQWISTETIRRITSNQVP